MSEQFSFTTFRPNTGPRTQKKYNLRGRFVSNGENVRRHKIIKTGKYVYYTKFIPTQTSEHIESTLDVSINETIAQRMHLAIQNKKLDLSQEIKIYGEFFQRKDHQNSSKNGFNILSISNVVGNSEYKRNTDIQKSQSPTLQSLKHNTATIETNTSEYHDYNHEDDMF